MTKHLRSLIAAAGLAAAALLPQAASAAPVTLTFEGIVNTAPVDTFYLASHGIDFNEAAFAFTGFAAAPSPTTVLSNFSCAAVCQIELTSTTGFNGSVSLSHTGFGSITVDIFDSGTNLIGTSGVLAGPNAAWVPESISFVGTGAMVRITGNDRAGSFAIDDIGLDLATTTTVPEPASFALVALALVGVAGATRRRRD